MKTLALILLVWMCWYGGAICHEDDLYNSCNKNGYAKGFRVDIECKEMLGSK